MTEMKESFWVLREGDGRDETVREGGGRSRRRSDGGSAARQPSTKISTKSNSFPGSSIPFKIALLEHSMSLGTPIL